MWVPREDLTGAEPGDLLEGFECALFATEDLSVVIQGQGIDVP